MVPTQNRSASVETPVSDQSSPTLPAHLVLEVTRGRTRFRRRPVNHPRFLIGAGSTCDLRLGGEGVPALHSIITVNGRDIQLEAIAAEPALLVNGRKIQQTSLSDGDLIVIGDVELVARLEAGHTPAAAQATAADALLTVETERPLAELSAAELVERIEQEELQIEATERRRHEGRIALLEAVAAKAGKSTTTGPQSGARAPVPAPHFLSKRPQILAAQTRQSQSGEGDSAFQRELEDLAAQLASLSGEIQGSTARATAREAQYTSAADLLMETQQKLVAQLEVLLDQVQGIKAQEPSAPKPRAIA